MLLTRLFLFSLLLVNTLDDNPQNKSIFISPVRIPLLLSANFGELRIDHYHSGLDIKTQGVTGKEVVAAADGYIYRISVTPGGFGKALYMRHPNGYSTVYGHLDKFTPVIEDYITDRQYEKKSYLITSFPLAIQFPVKQGEVIAWSGNSGSSAGPHLHYEIRKSESEIPVNPLLFEFSTEDNIAPVIERLVIYPVNGNTLINNQKGLKKINVSGGNGRYFIPAENEIRVNGLAGFGIKSFDLFNGSNNKCAIYSIELQIDTNTIFKYVMDGFSFDESRFINSHIDYETYIKENIYIERAYILPNDKLSVYKNVVNRGIFNFNDERIHHAEIIVSDAHNNKSVLSFDIRAQSLRSENRSETTDQNLKLMPCNRSNKFVSENVSVNIPAGALYDTIYFDYQKRPGTKEMLSDLYQVHNIYTPVHKAYTLSIQPITVPAGKESKMTIVQLGADKKKSAVNTTWADGYLKAEALSFGNFYIGIDSIAPEISANGLVSGTNLTGKKEIRIKITDDLSGIKSYEPTIDANWALFEYDQKNNLLIYRFDEKRITKGSPHSLSLKVSDNKDNTSYFNCDFIW